MNINVYIINSKLRSVFDNVPQPRGILIASIPYNRFRNWESKMLKQITSKMFRRFLADFDSRFKSTSNMSDPVLKYYHKTGILYPNFWTENLTTLLAKKHANLERFVAIIS